MSPLNRKVPRFNTTPIEFNTWVEFEKHYWSKSYGDNYIFIDFSTGKRTKAGIMKIKTYVYKKPLGAYFYNVIANVTDDEFDGMWMLLSEHCDRIDERLRERLKTIKPLV